MELIETKLDTNVDDAFIKVTLELLPEEIKESHLTKWIIDSCTSTRSSQPNILFILNLADNWEPLISSAIDNSIHTNVQFYFASLFRIGRQWKVSKYAAQTAEQALLPNNLRKTAQENISSYQDELEKLDIPSSEYESALFDSIGEIIQFAHQQHLQKIDVANRLWQIWKKEVEEFKSISERCFEELNRFFQSEEEHTKIPSSISDLLSFSFVEKEIFYLLTQSEAESLDLPVPLQEKKVSAPITRELLQESASILVVGDDLIHSLSQRLNEVGYSIETATSGRRALDLISGNKYHLVICDVDLPDMDGIEVLRNIKNKQPATQVITITPYSAVTRAIEAIKEGAFDYIEKPFDVDNLFTYIEKALDRNTLLTKPEKIRSKPFEATRPYLILGASQQMKTLYQTIESVAKSDANVLIIGESGTGKELIATAIHYNSLRAKKPFVKVNCAALPKELIESELFGHTKGAFTGAHADKEGLVQHAAGGSLLLDEIAEMPIELQPKLLRVLQERSYRKIGSDKTYFADFRLICTTKRLPAETIRDGLLRDDLFYRISTITIHVPPLRERTEDIPFLAEHFLKIYAEKYQRPITGISPAAYQLLFAQTWPGNVRELENVIERAVLLAQGKIEPTDLPFYTASPSERSKQAGGWDIPPNMTLEEIEKLVIEKTLQRTKGNKEAAANLLGIYRPRLYSKIRKYGIDIQQFLYRDLS